MLIARYETPADGGLAFEERARWIPSVNSSWHVGVDGLSVPLLALTAVVFCACAVYGLREDRRPRQHAALFLALQSTCMGLFAAQDLIVFFVFRLLRPVDRRHVRRDRRLGARESETYTLLLLGGLGAIVLAATDDLLVLAVGFLLASIPVYALVGMVRTPGAAEAALKTYLLGALSGILLLLGATVLSGIAGGTAYADLAAGLAVAPAAAVAVGALAVQAGLLFEAGGVPLHQWVPDATQGAGTAAAAFLTTVPKIGALVAAARLVDVLPGSLPWLLLVGLLAAATMTLANLAALAQTDFRGLARQRPGLAAALVISLLSLVGTPPTAVFLGKLTVFTAAWDGGLAWLVVVAAVNTLVSLFYYLRWLVEAFRPVSPHRRPAGPAARRWSGPWACWRSGSVPAW